MMNDFVTLGKTGQKKKKKKKKIWLQQVGFPFFLVCHIFHGYGYIGYGYGDNEDIMMEWWLL